MTRTKHWILIAALSVGACAERRAEPAPEVSCEEVGRRFLELARAELDAAEELPHEREAAGLALDRLAVGVVEECRAQAWSAQARQCLGDASSLAGARECEERYPKHGIARASAPGAGAEAEADAERVLAAAPAADRASCEAVATNLLGLAAGELAALPSEQAEALEARLPAMRRGLAATCVAGAWSPEARACLRAARTTAEAETCEPLLQPSPAPT